VKVSVAWPSVPGGFDRLFRQGNHDGVRCTIEDGHRLRGPVPGAKKKDPQRARKSARDVQQQVARSISEMTGMEVGHVNIHIEDIDYKADE